MREEFSRLELLLGEDQTDALKNKRIAIFGLGGVGGYVCEALVRCGIEHFLLVDNDVVSLSNLNRQIIATRETIGQKKTDVMRKRMESINNNVQVETIDAFVLQDNIKDFDLYNFDYVVDAIDTISGKIAIIERCKELNIPVISALGAGNKMNPSQLKITDINKTHTDPLAKVIRHELRKRNIKNVKVCFSSEEPIKPSKEIKVNKKIVPGSNSFVPSSMGLLIASEIIKDLTK